MQTLRRQLILDDRRARHQGTRHQNAESSTPEYPNSLVDAMSEASINITDLIGKLPGSGEKPPGFKPLTGSCNFQQGKAFEIWKHISKWPWVQKPEVPAKEDATEEQSKTGK